MRSDFSTPPHSTPAYPIRSWSVFVHQVHARGKWDNKLRYLPRKFQLQHARHLARTAADKAWLLAFARPIDGGPTLLHLERVSRGHQPNRLLCPRPYGRL